MVMEIRIMTLLVLIDPGTIVVPRLCWDMVMFGR